MQSPPLIAGLLVFVALVSEWLWSIRHRRALYHFPELCCNGLIFVGGAFLKAAAASWAIWLYSNVASFAWIALPETVGMFLLTLVMTDFAYYWYHRLNHEVAALWALHHTHHSSAWLNLTTAVRLNWLGKFISPFFFLPLVILGLPFQFVGLSLGAVLFYQFFLHTQAVPSLGKWEGVLFNTPSAHRVHHGSNSRYIDRNYGGIFVIWDRLFGTYTAELETVRFGVTTGSMGYNPLKVQFRPVWELLKGDWRREKHRQQSLDSNHESESA